MLPGGWLMAKGAPAAVIRELLKAADKQEEQQHEWPDDPGMRQMFRDDAKDMRKIAKMMKAGRYEDALDKALEMDTAPREEIPDSVWNYLKKAADYDRWE